ncbi:phosphonate metabolism transcriptional regulator PhnF [Qingshengfaniella alkalisoli]|uniref:Phosphonate metabolism transcriptional regulator PhnF n=1 Tax=Qingshengfaniella alkalisoli TaxID=2599296 RepID=A0A5B8J3Z4_9RHOB|nr:phosphonate metabolism transcriptional regulator PhnF [Qingshengfaniella alkalisoli]QDY71428.1 phosphonate metabolism transcriptional regulator PhnF [Qingshengfaniella alkalisoli]
MTRSTPLWLSIAETLKADIAAGHYAPGQKLPTEAELAQRFGVNRHTVRHALSGLVEDDLIYSRRGAGVFVAARPTNYPIGRRVRFNQNLIAAGQTPKRQILSLTTRPADERESKALERPLKTMVHVYEGISLADDVPVSLARSVFPADRFPGMLDRLAVTPSISEVTMSYEVGDHLRRSTELTAKLADATVANHLRIQEGAPVLRSVAVNTDADGTPIEYGRTWFAGDRISLTVEGDGS